MPNNALVSWPRGSVRVSKQQRKFVGSGQGELGLRKPRIFRQQRLDFSLLIPDLESFFTWHRRPRASKNYFSLPSDWNHEDTGIVLQGDLKASKEFTAETVKLYKKIFPGVKIVVSTWDTAHEKDLASLRALGVTVISNPLPEPIGIYNRNYQLLSTHSGLIQTKTLGVKYLLKTRVDQRLYSPHALSLMKGLIGAHPLSGPGANQNARIVAISNNTFISRVYGLSDFLTFGLAEDILKYWQSEEETQLDTPRQGIESPELYPEIFFCSRFLKQTGWNCAWSQEDWQLALKHRFIVVDGTSLDFFWNKYTSREILWRRYGQIPQFEEVTFGRWIETAYAS